MLVLGLVGTYLYNNQKVLNHIRAYLRNVAPTLDPKIIGSFTDLIENRQIGDLGICRFTLDFHMGLQPLCLFMCTKARIEILFAFYLLKVQVLFRHALGFRQITPSCLPTFSKAAKTLSNCSSVWVAM